MAPTPWRHARGGVLSMTMHLPFDRNLLLRPMARGQLCYLQIPTLDLIESSDEPIQNWFDLIAAGETCSQLLGDLRLAEIGAGNLPADCASGVCVVSQIHSSQDSFLKTVRIVEGPQCGFQALDHVAGTSDLGRPLRAEAPPGDFADFRMQRKNLLDLSNRRPSGIKYFLTRQPIQRDRRSTFPCRHMRKDIARFRGWADWIRPGARPGD